MINPTSPDQPSPLSSEHLDRMTHVALSYPQVNHLDGFLWRLFRSPLDFGFFRGAAVSLVAVAIIFGVFQPTSSPSSPPLEPALVNEVSDLILLDTVSDLSI